MRRFDFDVQLEEVDRQISIISDDVEYLNSIHPVEFLEWAIDSDYIDVYMQAKYSIDFDELDEYEQWQVILKEDARLVQDWIVSSYEKEFLESRSQHRQKIISKLKEQREEIEQERKDTLIEEL